MTGAVNRPANPEKPEVMVQESVSIQLISGNTALFGVPYGLLCCLFSLCILFAAAAAAAVILAAVSENGMHRIFALLKQLVTLAFGGGALKNNPASALIGAYGLAALPALIFLACLFGMGIRALKTAKIKQNYSILALLPGRKREVVPCSEGIYKLMVKNPLTKNKYYALFPWDKLSLYVMDEQKRRIILKKGKIRMPMLLDSDKIGKTKQFDQLKAVVRRHLPENNQTLPAKKVQIRWVRSAAALVILLALQIALSGWLEAASNHGEGTGLCDVGGAVHLTYRPSAPDGEQDYKIQLIGSSQPIGHTYCELHGALAACLHPSLLIHMLKAEGMRGVLADPVLILDRLAFPIVIWLGLIWIAVRMGKPPVYRHGKL